MARDLFEEAGIQYGGGGGGGRDLFAEAGIQATPKPSDATKKGFWGSAGEIASDLGKRISGSAIHGVAAIPLGIEQGVKGGIRNAVTGGADVVMPAGIYSPGLDTDESIFGPETDEQKARRKLKAEEAVSAIPSIPGSAWLERKGKQAQEAINKTTSEATQRAVENSQVTGNIFKGEIDFGTDPSVRGFVMQASDVFGTMLPSLVTTLITKNPAIGGVVGGGQAASEGAVEARDFIEGKTHEQLLKESPFYAQMLKGGATPAQARKLTADRGAETAALFQGIVGGAGDAVTGKLITGQLDDLIGKVAGKSIVARGVAGGVLSSAEQGSQEVGEGVAADIGMKSVVRSKEVGEGSAGNFVLGALGGVGPGSAQGVRSAVGERMAARQAKAATEAAPAPAPTASPAESPQAAQRPQATTQQPGGRGQFDYAAYDAYRTTLESGGRADATATTSSATGLHQFTDKTWLNTVKSAKPAWSNGLTDAQVLALRTDPDKSTEMVRVLDNENATRLQGAKQPVTAHNLYAAHHFGSGRAIDFAKAGDNVLMNNILTPAQIKANSYLDGKTKAEAIAIWDRRAAKAGVKVDGSTTMAATPTQQEQAAPDPIADQPVHSQAEAEAEAAPAATQEAAANPERVAEIDEETAALERRQKKLQDSEYGSIFDTEREAIAQELADLRRERDEQFAQSLMPEPAAEVAQPAPMAAPKPTPPIQSEAAALQARQQQTGAEPVLQNRDRATKASIDQMNAIASNPDYMMAGVSRSMDTGAPVVVGTLPASATLGRTETVVDGKRDRIQTQYAVVEAGDVLTSNAADGTPNADYATGQQGKVRAVAGNARSAGLIAGYERGTTSNYRSELEADAEAHGIPAEVIRGMTNPVLVRVMNAADLKQDAGDRSNIGAGARLSPAEEAANDARRVDLAAIEFDDDGMPRANSVLGFVQAMPVTERNAMLMKDGRPSKQAVDRLMAATFRAAYGSDALTELYAAAQDQEARTVMAGIARSAGAMAKLEGAGEFDIRGLVTEAAQMAVNAARSGKKLSDWARNLDLDMSPDAAEVARFFADNIRSANRIAEGLREWAGLALEQALAVEQNEAGPGMFGGDIPTLTREQLIERLNNATDQQTDLADTGGPVAAAQDTEGRTPGRRREGSGQEDGRVDRAEVPQEAAQVAVQENDQVDGAARSDEGGGERSKEVGQKPATLDERRAAAVQDFKGAMADLADIATKHQRAAVVPESAPDLMPTLVRLFDAAIRIVGTDVRAATRWVQAQLRADPDTKKLVNRIEPQTYRKAASQAVAAAGEVQDGMFASAAKETARREQDRQKQEDARRVQADAEVGGKGLGVDGAVSDKAASAADDALRQRFTLPIPMFGDVPYRASAPVDAGGAEVLSSRVMVASTKLTKRDLEVLGLSPGKTKVYAWRVSVVSGPYGVHSIIEAMDADHGRSSDGEVLARFKEVSNAEHVERVAPAVARAARADFAAQAQELESYTSDDLRQRDNERQQADTADQRQRQDDARRAQADAERGEFTLTGSDRAVDVAEAHGQQTMFSRARTPAQPRNLVTLHNLTVDNLLHADNTGGLPVPSLGITKVDSPFNGFGNITLIGPRGMIDPESGVPVFDRDAYTGRFPEMNYKRPKTKAAEALYNRMTAARELGGDGQSFVSQLWDALKNDRNPNPKKVAYLFERDRAPRVLYARDVLGRDIKVPMREQARRYPFTADKQLLAFVRKNELAIWGRGDTTNEQNTQALADLTREVDAAISRWAESNPKANIGGLANQYRQHLFEDGGITARALGTVMQDAKTVGVKVVDETKLEAAIRKVVPQDDAGYQAWVKALIDPLFEPPTITLRGREVEPTLDNLVAAMTIGQTAGAEKTMTSGTGKTAAMLGKQFKSIAEIQAARDQVVSEAAEIVAKKTNEHVLSEYQNAVLPFFKYKNWKGEVDTWAGLDAAMEALAGAGKRGSTDAAIRQALSKQGFTGVDQAIVTLARQSIDALRNTPTNYFEAKPQRAVGLDEFRGAVVPRGTDPRALAVLAKHGIEVVEHGKGEGARDKAIATLSKRLDKAGGDVLFSRAAEGGDPESQRQYRQVDTPEFKRWFGDSKVVDSKGEPLVVYHGAAKDIAQFDVSRSGQSTGNTGFYGAGAYFTQDTASAAGYAGWAQRTEEDAPNLIPAYLSIQSPVYVHLNPKTEAHRARSRETVGALVGTLESEGFFGPAASANEAGSELARLRSFIEKADFERSMGTLYRLLNGGQGVADLAQRAGFDGVLVYATKDGRESLEEAVAFRPEQIKSAIGNSGAFDPANPDIRMSSNGAAAQQRGMPVADLQTMTDRVAKALPNLPAVNVLQSTQDTRGELRAYLERQGAMDDAEGAFHKGELYLFADNLVSMERAEHVLATHEAGHAGLAGMLGADKARVLQALLNRNDKLFRQAQAEAKRLNVPLLTAVEEVLVDMKPADLVKLDGWRKVVFRVQRWLDRSGFKTLAKQMRQWMEGRLTDQQQADMMAAGLMFAAHDYLAGRGMPAGSEHEAPATVLLRRAWHGSPYTFDKFSTDHMGKGEGAQAYGWGLYFAGKRAIAEHYKRALETTTRGGLFYKGERMDSKRWNELYQSGDSAERAVFGTRMPARNVVKALEGRVSELQKDLDTRKNLSASWRSEYERRIDSLKAVLANMEQREARKNGRLYEVNIPEDDQYLLWDKPLDEQPEKVRAALVAAEKDRLREILAQREDALARRDAEGQDTAALKRQVEILKEEIADENLSLGGSGERYYRALSMKEGSDKAASEALRAAGIAGIKYLDGSSRSAGDGSFNYVVFDDADVSIETMFSRATTPQPGAQGQQAQTTTTVAGRAKARLHSLVSPERVDAFIYSVQDKLIDLKRLRAHIQELGGTVNDLNDAYQGEELYHGRVARRSASFLENEVAPLMKELRSEGYTIQQLEQYLHARHAPEANRVLAERNPNEQMIDAKLQEARTQVRDLERQLQRARAQGTSVVALEKALELAKEQEAVWKSAEAFRGTEEERLSLSGMSDADAAAHMAGLSTRDAKRLALIAERVDAIQKGTTDALVDYGLHDQETIDAWRDTYQHYVPLHRDEAHESAASHPIGQGFSVRGDASKRRVGSNQKVTNIFSHVVMQREAAITRGEKNHVAKQLYLMARQNQAPEWWSTDKAPRKRTVDKSTGLVHTTVDPQYRTRENAVVARIAGREVAVVFNERNERAMRLARALKNLDGSDLPFLLNMSAKVTRYFSAINTQYNPVFGVVNFARDTQAVLLNMESAGIAGGRVAMMRTLGSTYRAIWREARGKTPTNQSWSQLWDQLREDGGTTGYRELFAMPEDRAKALQRELTRDDASAPVKAGRAVLKLLEDYNDSMENATRLAVYKVALDRGMSRQQAASVTKNITVNFNRKGANSRQLGSLYAFFNAAVQGMARMVQTLSGPTGKKVMLGGVALGAMNTMLGYMMMGGGDDQDDEWARIPEFVKVNSIVIPTSRTNYVAIPMPLGFNMFPNLGRIATEWAMGIGNKGGGERSLEMLGAIIDAFNPLGGGGNIPQVLAPTVLDPALALIQNRDWKNQPVFQEDFNSMDPTPGHQRVKESASAFSRAAAKGINSATGGTDFMPGAWSPTPDQLDFVIGQITGGVGRESLKLMQAVGAQFTGDELPAHKVPLVGRFSGSTTGPSGGAGQFYDNIRRLNTLENELIGRNRAGEDTTSLYRENPETALIPEGKMAYNQVSRLRKDRIREREEKRDGYQDVIKSIDADIDLYMRELNRNMGSRAIREAGRAAAR